VRGGCRRRRPPPRSLGELRRCSAHPCSSGKALGEALVGESPRRELPDALRESATRRWRETVARVLAISRSLAPGGLAGCAGLLAKAAAAAARAGLVERGGVGHERGAESSSARALAGPRRCAGDRRPDLERAIFRMRVVPGTDPGWDGMILLLR
jgi:hypothetical protein